MIRDNPVKRKIRNGEYVLGTFAKLYDPAAVELLGLLGFDFIVLDNEHVAMNRESMVNIIRAADTTGLVPIVRVRENRPVEILQAMDEGALGVMVPQVDTLEDALRAVRSVKYSPEGERGYAPTHRAAGYGTMDPVEYAKRANEMTFTACYCESVASMSHLGEIVKVEGIDVIFIGPFDLSQSMGFIGQAKHPEVLAAIDSIISQVRSAGKAVGIIAADVQEAKMWMDKGVQYITISSDMGMMASTAKSTVQGWKSLMGS